MAPRHEKRRSFKFRPPLITGKIPPAVDVADRDALYDFMEARH